MKHFKDLQGMIHAFEEDGSQDFLIQDTMTSISNEEAEEIRQNKIKNNFNKLTYAQKRASEYPDFKDYLDGIVKGDTAQQEAYIAACLAVKTKYPKK